MPNYLLKIYVLLITLILPQMAFASDINGASLSLVWGIPFAGILLSIALGPILFSTIWHHHFGKITAAWSALFLLPFIFVFGRQQTALVVAYAMLDEYLPFIILLLSLFTVSSGILIKGNLHGSPKLNLAILMIGTALASLMGTTGVAILLIRPLLRANDNRKHRIHTVVFFIFLVANIGGGLTPLGDPPLFLGFLKGVSFIWTIKHMMLPVFVSSIFLLILFYLIDSYYYRREDELNKMDPTPDSSISIHGKINFVLLCSIVTAVLISGTWKSGITITILSVGLSLQNISRDLLLILATILSLVLTKKEIRAANQFNWEPILEVGKLFAGIFITITPVLAILRAGSEGHLAKVVNLVSDNDGSPINAMYFWICGLLSSFLDNAPTYLLFFNLAAGDPTTLMGPLTNTLLAISMGSVFMGAMTYIGNAPNFMVRSIALQQGVAMPSFFGYMKWSIAILIPLFILLTALFFLF